MSFHLKSLHHCAAACAAATLLLSACSKPVTEAPAPQPSVNGAVIAFPGQKDPPELRLAEVMPASERPLQMAGRLVWDEDLTARIYAPFSGRVERLQVRVGQAVGTGAALAYLSAAELGAAQADLQKARADERMAAQQLERARALVEVGAVARKDLEAAEAEQQRATAELQRAGARLKPYASTSASAPASAPASTPASTPASGHSAGSVGATAGGIHQTLALTSPVAGVVVERNINPGLEVRPDVGGPPLFVVSDPRRLWVMLDLDETQLARVQPGARIELTTAAWPDARFEAQVLHVAEIVDPNSRTVKVRARVDNPKGQLRAEMFVQARLDAHDGLPLVPADAVFVRGNQLGVFVSLGGGRYERRFVKLRTAGPQWWHVVEGLKAGEKAVIGGALFLNQMLDAAQ